MFFIFFSWYDILTCIVSRFKKMLRRILHLGVLVCILGNPCECIKELQHGYSRIQYGHRLDSRTIDTYGGVSFLDCVKECLVTTRCKSINYHKGANYCETNYEDHRSASYKFTTRTRWLYSEKGDWPNVSTACARFFDWLIFKIPLENIFVYNPTSVYV